MQHLRWEKTGRIFNHANEGKPNQFTWKSSMGQSNVDLGNGQFAPYVWNPATRIIKFGECELRFTASGLEFWKGVDKLNTLSFNPEWKQGVNWRRRVPSVGSLSIIEIDPGNSKVELKISYTITTSDSITEVFVRVGYNHKVHFGTRFKALVAGAEQRIALEFAELFTPVEERDRQGTLLPTARFKTDKTWIAVKREELPDHEFELTTKTKVHIGRKVYALNEEKIVSPTTWGTDVGIAATGDDGSSGFGTWNATAIYLGDNNEAAQADWYHAGFRWTGLSTITQGSTIDSALLDVNVTEQYTGAAGDFYAWDADEAGQFSGATTPWTVTKTTASVAFTATGTGWKTITVTTIVQEIITSYATNTINFAAIARNYTSLTYYAIEDYADAGTNEAELTITYTAAGGLSMDASPGSLSLSGIATGILAQRLISGSPGSYSLTGISSTIGKGYFISAEIGSYSVSGINSTLLADRLLSSEVGSYAVSGIAASVLANRLLSLSPGEFAISGIGADVLIQRIISAISGSYEITGIPTSVLADRILSLSNGEFTTSGAGADVLAQRVLPTGIGSYEITGSAAQNLVDRLLSASPGSYEITGILADLIAGGLGAYILSASPGSYQVIGNNAQVLVDRLLVGSFGEYAITGVDGFPLIGRVLGVDAGQYIVTGTEITALADRILSGSPGTYVITGEIANLLTGLVGQTVKLVGIDAISGKPIYFIGKLYT